MSRTSVAEVCLLILADNRGIATYLLVCIAPVISLFGTMRPEAAIVMLR